MTTTGADHVLPRETGTAVARRSAALACVGSGVAGALANVLFVAFVVLDYARPGDVQATFGPLACVFAGISAALLAPVALHLGGTRVSTLGAATTACLTGSFLLLSAGLLTPLAGGEVVAGGGLGLAAWLVLVCLRHTVPPRAARFGRRAGVAALVGTLAVLVVHTLLPPTSQTAMLVTVLGGVPAVLGWLAVPAWSLRMGLWLRLTEEGGPERP